MPSQSPQKSAIQFVLLTYAFSWGVVVPTSLLTSAASLQFTAVAVSAFGPLVAATVLTWRSDRRLRAWVRDTLTWRVPRRWYVAAVGVPLAGVGVQAAVYALFVGSLDLSVLPQRTGMFVGGYVAALLFTGGNEEFGWRGYMLPHLQQAQSALSASLVVGVAWLLWHLPSDLLMTSLGGGAGWSPDRIAMRLAVLPLSVILAWLYNSSRGSVLLAMLFHAGWNSMSILVPAPLQTASTTGVSGPTVSGLRIVLVCFVTLVAIGIVVRYDAETLSANEKQRWKPGE